MFRIVALVEGKQPICDFRQAFEIVQKEIKDVVLAIYNTIDVDQDDDIFEECMEQTIKADFLVFNFHGSMAYFRKYLKFQEYFQGKKPYLFYSSIESEMEEMTRRCMLPQTTVIKLLSYLEAGGEKNRENFWRCLLNKVADIDCSYGEVCIPIRDGYYRKPEKMSDEEYLNQISLSQQPIVGVLTHFQTIQSGNTENLDQLYDLIQKIGCTPVIIYTRIMPSSDFRCSNNSCLAYKLFLSAVGRIYSRYGSNVFRKCVHSGI